MSSPPSTCGAFGGAVLDGPRAGVLLFDVGTVAFGTAADGFAREPSPNSANGLRRPTGCDAISTPKSFKLINTRSSKILVSNGVDLSLAGAPSGSRPSVVSSVEAGSSVMGGASPEDLPESQ